VTHKPSVIDVQQDIIGIISRYKDHISYHDPDERIMTFHIQCLEGKIIIKIERQPNDIPWVVNMVQDFLDGLQTIFGSSMWKQVPEQEKIRLVGRLSHIMEIVERRDLEK